MSLVLQSDPLNTQEEKGRRGAVAMRKPQVCGVARIPSAVFLCVFDVFFYEQVS